MKNDLKIQDRDAATDHPAMTIAISMMLQFCVY